MTSTALHPNHDTTRTQGVSSPLVQLKIASILTAGLGLFFVSGAHDTTDGLLRWIADLIFWPVGDPAAFSNEAQLLAAILGGVMVSWAVLIWMLTNALGHDKPQVLRQNIFLVMAIWFIIDSAGSVASGGWLNAVGNVGFLAMFIVPASRLR